MADDPVSELKEGWYVWRCYKVPLHSSEFAARHTLPMRPYKRFDTEEEAAQWLKDAKAAGINSEVQRTRLDPDGKWEVENADGTKMEGRLE